MQLTGFVGPKKHVGGGKHGAEPGALDSEKMHRTYSETNQVADYTLR